MRLSDEKELWEKFWTDETQDKIKQGIRDNVKRFNVRFGIFSEKEYLKKIFQGEEIFCRTILEGLVSFVDDFSKAFLILWDIHGTLGYLPTRGSEGEEVFHLRESLILLLQFIKKTFPHVVYGVISDEAYRNIKAYFSSEKVLLSVAPYFSSQKVYSVNIVDVLDTFKRLGFSEEDCQKINRADFLGNKKRVIQHLREKQKVFLIDDFDLGQEKEGCGVKIVTFGLRAYLL